VDVQDDRVCAPHELIEALVALAERACGAPNQACSLHTSTITAANTPEVAGREPQVSWLASHSAVHGHDGVDEEHPVHPLPGLMDLTCR
jgi:hypothetical protein